MLSLLLAGLILLAWHEEPKQGTTLSLEISSGSSKEKITCWQSDSGESYFFLPSYGELDEARFRVSGKGTLALDGTVLTDGMSCGGLVLDKPYNLTNGAGDSMGSVTFVRGMWRPSIWTWLPAAWTIFMKILTTASPAASGSTRPTEARTIPGGSNP